MNFTQLIFLITNSFVQCNFCTRTRVLFARACASYATGRSGVRRVKHTTSFVRWLTRWSCARWSAGIWRRRWRARWWCSGWCSRCSLFSSCTRRPCRWRCCASLRSPSLKQTSDFVVIGRSLFPQRKWHGLVFLLRSAFLVSLSQVLLRAGIEKATTKKRIEVGNFWDSLYSWFMLFSEFNFVQKLKPNFFMTFWLIYCALNTILPNYKGIWSFSCENLTNKFLGSILKLAIV